MATQPPQWPQSSSPKQPQQSPASAGSRAKAIGSAVWTRYRSYSGRAQVILAVLALVLVCGTCGSITSAGGSSTGSDTSSQSSGQGSTAQISSGDNGGTSATDTPAAATDTPIPPTPTDTPVPPTPTVQLYCSSGVPCNPWGYHFGGGQLIYSPAAGFCDYFNCISSFSNGTGYVVECANGQYSLSGGHKGVCSKQGGEAAILYS